MKINKKYTVTDRKKYGGKRTKPISVLIPHQNAGVASGENVASFLNTTTRVVSANYVIGQKGEIFETLDESFEPYTTGDRGIDGKGVTFELVNSTAAPEWKITDATFDALVELSIDICKRNGIKEVNYTGDKTGNIQLHEMYAATNCPGPYVKGLMPEYAKRINEGLRVTKPPTPSKLKYKVGDKVNFKQLSTQSNGGKVITSYYKSGTIGKIYPNAQYPYRIGTNTGFLNDSMILDINTPVKPKPTPQAIKVGDKVVLSNSATVYATGQTIPRIYKGKTYTVQQVRAGQVLLKELYSWVFAKDVGGQSQPTPIKVGDKVKIKNSAQVYATGQKIPNQYKNKWYTVQQLRANQALIKELYSWVFTKDIVK